MKIFIHKKTGNPYKLLTDKFMYKENGEWKRNLILYKTLYENLDGKYFARSAEDFFENFVEQDIEESGNIKVVIEKELANPQNGNICGPFYHVYSVNENTGEKEELKVFDGNIKEAAGFAERNIDFQLMEIAYQTDQNCFSSSVKLDIKNESFLTKEIFQNILNAIKDYHQEKKEKDFDSLFNYVKQYIS